MNQERAKQFMRDFDKVFERSRETTGVEEINELKEYFINEHPEIFQVECCLEKVNKELDKKIEDVEKTLLTSISMEPFTNYEGIENDRTLSTVQKIVLYQRAIDDKKRRHIYYSTNQGKLLEKCFIQGRDVYKKTLKESGLSRQWAHFLRRLVKLIEDYNRLLYCTIDLKFIRRNFNIVREIKSMSVEKYQLDVSFSFLKIF